MNLTKDRIVIYLSGPITGHPNYKAEFKEAEKEVRRLFSKEFKKVLIINPCDKPWNVEDGFEYEECLHMDYACIDVADIVVLIPGWQKSPGANREMERASSVLKKVFDLEVMLKDEREKEGMKEDIKSTEQQSEFAKDLLEDEE